MLGKLKDTRLIASAIAVACMLVDDLPETQYNTFHDPGAAAMLSIVVADVFTLAFGRGSKTLVFVVFWPVLLLKLFIQPFFWVQNAWFWDVGTLVLFHVVLGFFAVRGAGLRIRLISSVTTLAGVGIALFAVFLISLTGSSWIHFYFELAAARVVIPCAFWTAVLIVENRLMTPNLPATGVEGSARLGV